MSLGSLLAALVAAVALSPAVRLLDTQAVKWSRAEVVGSDYDWTIFVTSFGDSHVIAAWTIAGALALLAGERYRAAATVALSVVGAQVVVAALKALIERPRPLGAEALAQASGYSFPSGHSASSMALYGSVALVAAGWLRGPMRTGAIVVGAAVVAGVGATRVYLGVHFPTDVAAGWIVGAMCALGAWWLSTLLTRRLQA